MDQMWAPWRMAYINPGGSSDAPDEGCIFCAKPQQSADESNLVLWRSERCYVLMNLFPYNNGHLMVAPYAHVPSIAQLDAATLTDMMLTVQRCLAALDAALHPQGYNMGINQGTVAGAGIADHIHFHIVPRWNGDTNFMPVLADVKVMPDFLQHTYQQIHEQLIRQAQERGEVLPESEGGAAGEASASTGEAKGGAEGNSQ